MYTSCRGSSIKTRIETSKRLETEVAGVPVAEVVPLKQGLKLQLLWLNMDSYQEVAEVVPLKQGLKLCVRHKYKTSPNTVAEVVPLKQGLKPSFIFEFVALRTKLQR